MKQNLTEAGICSSGDPTDTNIKLRPLEPASGQALARDLVLKTRRRKGLGDQIAVSKYLDDEFVVSGWLWKRDETTDSKNKISSHCPRLGMPTCSAERGKGCWRDELNAYVALRKTVNKQTLYLIACFSL
jgi:hypothetical protein